MLNIMTKLQVSSLLLLNIINFVYSYDVNGFCGNPGKPFNSVLEPDKQRYSEGEEVTYQCNEYWNYLKTRKCVKGKWTGSAFRCGKTLDGNDLNYIKVEDVSKDLSQVILEKNVTLLPNYKFPNSFLSSRYPPTIFQVESDKKIRWTFKIEKPASIPFFRINFQFINLTVEESEKISVTASAIVSPYRTCTFIKEGSNKIWRLGTKVELNFECDANSESDYLEDTKNPSNTIVLETQTSKQITYKLIAVFLAQPYGTSDNPICGEPQRLFGQLVRILWPYRDFAIDCTDAMDYVSKKNPDLPDTTIHFQKCIYDMKWNGTYPECKPKVVCPLPSVELNEINPMVNIAQLNDVFYFNETQWFAIDGSIMKYECNDPENQILLGDSIHRCKNGLWIGRTPHCFDISGLKNKKIKNRAIDTNNNEELDF